MSGETLKEAATLASALAQLQADLPEVRKGETAEVQTKSGGKFSYSYADLADCNKAVMPRMAALGLSFSAKPTLAEGGFVLRYVLRHSSGEFDGGDYPLPDPSRGTPQEIGSAITYARRYTLCSVTGLAPSDDDDGAAATQAAKRNARQPPSAPKAPKRDWPAEVEAASTVEAVQALWRQAVTADEMTDPLAAAIKARGEALKNAATDADPWTTAAPEAPAQTEELPLPDDGSGS